MTNEDKRKSGMPRLLKGLFRKKEKLKDQLFHLLENSDIAVSNEQKQMISGVANLAELTAGVVKIPVQRMRDIDLNSTLKEIAAVFQKSGHSRLPVYQEKNGQKKYIGFFFAKDLLPLLIKREGRFKPEENLRPLYVVPETQSLLSLLRDMRLKKQHLVLTVNEHGDVTGLVTLEDILEEIVGEIRDEFDKEKNPIAEVGHRKYRVDPIISLQELNANLPLNLPEEEFNSLSGFLLHQLKGEVESETFVTIGNTVFTVDKASGNHIKSVTIEFLPDTE